jgi:hypothetical protein
MFPGKVAALVAVLAAAFGLAEGARGLDAEETTPDLKEIKSAWKERQARFRSGKFSWSTRSTVYPKNFA